MQRKIKTLIYSILLGSLFGCSSMMHPDTDRKAEKRLQAAKANTQLGMAYLQKHEIQHAKQKLLLALDEAPKLPEAWYAMAYLMEVTGDPNANRYYLKAIDLAPKKGDVHNNYGTYLCRNGEYKEAVQHFMIAIRDPDYLESASAYENAGLCALKIPDKKLALTYFNRSIQEDPNRPGALLEAATLNYETKNYAVAKTQLAQFQSISAPTKQSLALSRILRNIDMPEEHLLYPDTRILT